MANIHTDLKKARAENAAMRAALESAHGFAVQTATDATATRSTREEARRQINLISKALRDGGVTVPVRMSEA